MTNVKRMSADARKWTIDMMLRKHPGKTRLQVSATITAMEDVGQGEALETVARFAMAKRGAQP